MLSGVGVPAHGRAAAPATPLALPLTCCCFGGVHIAREDDKEGIQDPMSGGGGWNSKMWWRVELENVTSLVHIKQHYIFHPLSIDPFFVKNVQFIGIVL